MAITWLEPREGQPPLTLAQLRRLRAGLGQALEATRGRMRLELISMSAETGAEVSSMRSAIMAFRDKVCTDCHYDPCRCK